MRRSLFLGNQLGLVFIIVIAHNMLYYTELFILATFSLRYSTRCIVVVRVHGTLIVAIVDHAFVAVEGARCVLLCFL